MVFLGALTNDKVRFGLGMLYVFPFYYLFREKLSRIVVVMCLCYNYTISIYLLSRQIAQLTGAEAYSRNLFILQTILFLLTIVPFHTKMVKKFTYTLKQAGKLQQRWSKYLSIAAVINVITLTLFYELCVDHPISILQVPIVVCFIVAMYLMYSILYEILVREQEINALDQRARKDELTGLYNRRSMLEDLENLIHTKHTFTLLFMDLDRFKLINDRYGHVIGDEYLKHFANMTQRIFQNQGRLYRFGGDEFVLICQGVISRQVVEQMRENKLWEKNSPCPFLGVSVGVKVCRPPHPGLEEIIILADKEMYRRKQYNVRANLK